MAGPQRVGFVMEQTLGHVTFGKNLRAGMSQMTEIDSVWMPISADQSPRFAGLSNLPMSWAARGSLRAYGTAREVGLRSRLDALFFHTQTLALLSPLLARTTPTIVSLDATPLNYDTIGPHYGHFADPRSPIEKLKQAVYRRLFASASWLVPWSMWVRDSLCRDYGVDPARISVVPPGVDLSLFADSEAQQRAAGPVRILFVGGDFERKGGQLLLDCFRAGISAECELHLVTPYPVPPGPGIHVYPDLTPNDPRLMALYRTADIFALPTYADCLGIAALEAMAAGLPVVSTRVGALPEVVEHGRSGLLVQAGSAEQLGRALRRLAADSDLRERMARRGRELAELHFDLRCNAVRVAAAIANGIDQWNRGSVMGQLDCGRALR
jgi:glycosyltransferase involved in cell wall biosynthesis